MNIWAGDELNYLLNKAKVRDKRDVKWIYQINKEDEYMMKCKHDWVDAELNYYPERWDRDLEDYVTTLAFSHCKMCGAQRSKESRGAWEE